MAITPAHPGFEVTIDVDGIALPEYDYVPPGPTLTPAPEPTQATPTPPSSSPTQTVTKYIEIPENGADFTIRWMHKPPFNEKDLTVGPNVSLDGKYIHIPKVDYDPKDGHESYVCLGGQVGLGSFVQSFRFSPVVVEENHNPITEEVRQELAEWGNVKISFEFVEQVGDYAIEEPITPAFEDVGVLSEKVVQKETAVKGDVPTLLSAPAATGGGNLTKYRSVGNGPFATFVFKYRSTNSLKDLAIFSRTPISTPPRSPTPLCDRDPDTLSADQMREALLQLRARQEGQIRVKREREANSTATLRGKYSDDVVWCMTQPAKRARRFPGAGDQVVPIEDY